VRKDIDQGHIHTDMFLLTHTNKDDTIKYKWTCVKPTGTLISPRCGISAAVAQSTVNQAFLFGGVYDEDNEENLHGIFYNDLFALDLENLRWRSITLSEKKETVIGTDECRRRRKKQEEETNKELKQSIVSEETVEDHSEKFTCSIDKDGIFTVSFYFIN
jgi:hypothetical protein